MVKDERTAAGYLAGKAADPVRVAKEAMAQADRSERKRALRVVEVPVVADLQAVGIEVDLAWDLVNTSDPYLDALPVLLRHLKRGGYPPRIVQGIARALAVKPAVTYWDELVALYKSAVEPVGTRAADAKDGLAVILSACVNRAKVGELVELKRIPPTEGLGFTSYGPSCGSAAMRDTRWLPPSLTIRSSATKRPRFSSVRRGPRNRSEQEPPLGLPLAHLLRRE